MKGRDWYFRMINAISIDRRACGKTLQSCKICPFGLISRDSAHPFLNCIGKNVLRIKPLRTNVQLLLFLIFSAAFTLFGDSGEIFEDGDILSVSYEGTLSPGEINEFIRPLFEGETLPEAEYSVDIYWIVFHSTYPDGAAAPVTAQIFIPQFRDEAPRSIYNFGPGSTGLRDSCRPSREHTAGIRWGLYRAHVLAHAGQGSIGIMPDYMGFNDPERYQYYMVAECEAKVMLHAFTALENLLNTLDVFGITDVTRFVAGFSQGGHAAFAAADFQAEFAQGFELDGVIGYGPSTNLFALFKEYPDVAPMALYIFRDLYGADQLNPDWILKERFASRLDRDVVRMCVGAMQSYYPIDPVQLFTEEFSRSLLDDRISHDYPSVYRILKENSTGLSGHGVPVLILQGTNDIVVYHQTQKDFADALETTGVDVDYRLLEGARHDTRQRGFFDARRWIDLKTEGLEIVMDSVNEKND